MSDDELTIATAEPPEYETGPMVGEILGVTEEQKDVGGPDDTEWATFIQVRLGLENGHSQTLDYPKSEPATTGNMLGRLLSRFGLLDPGNPVDVREIVGEDIKIDVTAGEDREDEEAQRRRKAGEPVFAQFDRDTLRPA